jgi:hypothetical protein
MKASTGFYVSAVLRQRRRQVPICASSGEGVDWWFSKEDAIPGILRR